MNEKKLKRWMIAVSALWVGMTLTACRSFDTGMTSEIPEVIEKEQVSEVVVVVTDEDRATALIGQMTLEEKIGQMFYVRYPDTNGVELIKEYHLGGYLLFAKDFQERSKEELIGLTESLQMNSGKIKLLIGVDEEGGTVNRVSRYKAYRNSPFLSPQDLYNEGGWELIERDTAEKSLLLKSLGINVNMAPVCDLSTNPSDFINKRAFGGGATETAEYVMRTVKVMKEQQIGSVLKHFPGYGNNGDTHSEICMDQRPYDIFEKADFLPFEAGIQEGTGAVLVSHNIVTAMDDQYPASLSKPIHDILRSKLGFEGVIMTDDLSMAAIQKYTSESEAAVLAVMAGNDLLCCTDFQIQMPAVIEAVKNGMISEEQIDQSVLRILLWKIELGLL